MRKLTWLIVSLFLATAASSQSQFGLFAGPQLNSARYTIHGQKQTMSAKYGFQAGGGWKIPFENKLFFSPAAFYSLKGYKVALNTPSFPPDTLAVDNNTMIHTLELAFLLQYDFGKTANHFFIKAGPSLDFQLSGKEKFTRRDNTTEDRNMAFSFGDYGHYAASFLLQLGFETKKGFFIFGQYSHGLGSINNADGGPRICHRVLGLSVGQYLNKK